MNSLQPSDRATLSDRLNRIPIMTRTHKKWLVILAVLLTVDMADLNTFAYAAPAIRENWGLDVGHVGAITGASFLGMFVGSVIGGRIADHIGRKKTIIVATIFFSFFSLLSAAAVGFYDLTAYRILTGVGLATMTVVVLTYVSEMFPQFYRGRAQTLITAISLIGIPIMAWFARFVVPTGPAAWRWIFILGAIGLPLVVLAGKGIPESVRWLQEKGRYYDAQKIVEQVENEARERVGELPPAVAHLVPTVKHRAVDLFGGSYIKRTIVLAIVMSLLLSAFYGFNSWVPTLLTEHGFTTAQSLVYSSIMSLAAVPGALFVMLFIDKIDRRTAALIVYAAVAVLMLVTGFTNNTVVLVIGGSLVTMLLQSGTPVLYTYMPEIFPTGLRAFGTGIGNGVGRLAVFATSFFIAWVLATLGYAAVFLYLAGAAFLGGLLLQLFGERTKGRSLEDIVDTKDNEQSARA